MKTLKTIFCSAAIGFTLANFIPRAIAQVPALRQQNFGAAAGERFFPALNRVLTDDQRKSFRALIEPQFAKIQPLQEKVRESRKSLLDKIADGKFDETAARQNAQAIANADVELTVIFAKALSQMQPPLSAQQIEQMKNFQPGQAQPQLQSASPAEIAPRPVMDLPPPLPRDSNGLPVVAPQK